MTKESWQKATSFDALLSRVRLTESQNLHFQLECLTQTHRSVPCAGVYPLLKATEALCSGRVNIGLVDLARRRVANSIGEPANSSHSILAGWRKVVRSVFRDSAWHFARSCLELIQLDALEWVTAFPIDQLERCLRPEPSGYRAVALHTWDAVWESSKDLDSWAGSFNHVWSDARNRVTEAVRSSVNRDWAHLVRCIVGNPFRPVTFAPSWRSETGVSLASGIYAERAFDRLPILADALEEAGCDHADALSHCRGPGPHARGCWVVDGVLGKS